MRLSEELTFEDFARQVKIGKTLAERIEFVEEDGVLEELQALVVEASQMILIKLDDAAAADITPGMYLKISTFFRQLADAIGAAASESGSSSAPDASDSLEDSAAA
jgi:hypothetical protein